MGFRRERFLSALLSCGLLCPAISFAAPSLTCTQPVQVGTDPTDQGVIRGLAVGDQRDGQRCEFGVRHAGSRGDHDRVHAGRHRVTVVAQLDHLERAEWRCYRPHLVHRPRG